jgi:hypothetical protein
LLLPVLGSVVLTNACDTLGGTDVEVTTVDPVVVVPIVVVVAVVVVVVAIVVVVLVGVVVVLVAAVVVVDAAVQLGVDTSGAPTRPRTSPFAVNTAFMSICPPHVLADTDSTTGPVEPAGITPETSEMTGPVLMPSCQRTRIGVSAARGASSV